MKRDRHVSWLFGIMMLCASTLLLTACNGDPTGSTDDDDDPPVNDPNTSTEQIGTNGGTITSTDGLVELTIPAGALDSNQSITIKVIDTDELGSEFDPVAALFGIADAYELGPDGLEFSTPITVRYESGQQLEEDEGDFSYNAEFLLTSSDGNLEPLDNIRTSADFDEGTIVVEGELSHFSPLATSQANNGVSFFVFNVPESMAVGSTFTARAEIHNSLAGPLGDIVSLLGPAGYEDNSGAPIEPTFTPTTAELSGNPDDGYTGMFEYTCTDEGIGVYRSELTVRVRFDLDSGPVTATSYAPYITTITCEAVPTFALTVEIEGEGSVASGDGGIACTGDCTEVYDSGEAVTLTPTPAEGWEFAGWDGDIPAACEDATGDCVLTMDENRDVTATFTEIEEEETALVFPNPLICIQHGNNQSLILWLWTFQELAGANYTVTMQVTFPGGGTETAQVSSSLEARKILALLDIFTFGNYTWEITNVQFNGVNILFSGATGGVVSVGAPEQNAGQCAF